VINSESQSAQPAGHNITAHSCNYESYPAEFSQAGRKKALTRRCDLDTSSSSAAGSSRSVVWNGCDVFNPADPETCSRQHSNCGLRAWTGCSSSMSARGSHSDVKSSDTSILRCPCSRSRRLHCCVWGALQSVCLNVLPTGTSGDSLCSSKVCDMHQCVVERGVNVSDTPALNSFL
jgi:hypothetical protein